MDTSAPTLSIAAELNLAAFLSSAQQGNAALAAIGTTADTTWAQAGRADAAITAITNMQTRADSLQRTLRTLAEANPKITVEDNFQQAQAQADVLQRTLTTLKDQPYTVEVKEDSAAARADLAELNRQVQTLKGEAPVITPQVNAAPAETAVTNLKGSLTELRTEMAATATAMLPMLVIGTLVEGFKALGDELQKDVGLARDWESALVNIANNSGLTNAQMATLGGTIQGAALQYGAAGDTLKQVDDAAFHAANYGFKSATEQTQILNATMQSAMSTEGNVSDITQVVSASLHEYGLGASHAAEVTDLIHVSATHADATFSSFAGSAGKVLGVAANLHVPMEQVDSALAALTQHGYSADEAATQMTAALTHMINPSKQASAELAYLSSKTGVDLVGDFSAAGLSSKGFTGELADLHAAFTAMGYTEEEATQATMKLLNAQRGGLGMATLLGQGAADYANDLAAASTITQGQATPSADSYARSLGTLAQQEKLTAAAQEQLGRTIGDVLLPSQKAQTQETRAGTEAMTAFAAKLADTKSVTESLGAAWSALTGSIQRTQADAVAAAQAQTLAAQQAAKAQGEAAAATKQAWGDTWKSEEQTAAEAVQNNQESAHLLAANWRAAGFEPVEADSLKAAHALVTNLTTAAQDAAKGGDSLSDAYLHVFDAIAADTDKLPAAFGVMRGAVQAEADKMAAGTAGSADAIYQSLMDAFHALRQDAAPEYKAMVDGAIAQLDTLHTKAAADAAQLSETWVSALGKMATETGVKAKSTAQAMLDGLNVLRQQVPPGMEAVRDSITRLLDQARVGGVQSIAGMHNQIVAILQQLTHSADATTAATAQVMLDNLDVTTPAATIGQASGDAYLSSLVGGVTGGLPNLDAYIKSLLGPGHMDVQTVTALLGKEAGDKYALNMEAGAALALQKMIAVSSELANEGVAGADKALAAEKSALAQLDASIKTDAKSQGDLGQAAADAAARATDAANRRGAAEDRAAAARQRAAAAHERALEAHQRALDAHATAVEKAAQREATAQAVSADQMIKDLGKAELATVDGTKTIAQAYADLVPVLTTKLPAGMEWLQTDYKKMLAQITSDTPPSLAQIGAQFQAWNDQILKSGTGAQRLLAQSNKDAFAAAEADAQAHAAQMIAATVKEQQGVIAAAGKMAEDTTKKTYSIGDAQLDMLSLIDSATKAKLPGMVDFANAEYTRLTTGAGLSMQQLHDDTLAQLTDLATQGTAIQRAWAQGQLADIKATDDQIAQQNRDAAAALLTSQQQTLAGLASVLQAASKPEHNIGAITSAALDLAKQATDAKMPQIATLMTQYAQQMAAGTAPPLASVAAQWQAMLDSMTASADPKEQAIAQSFRDTWATILADQQKADAQLAQQAEQAQLALVQGLGGLTAQLSGKDVSPPKALIAVYDLIEKLKAAGQGDWAGKLLADAQAVAKGVPGALDVMNADVLSRLIALENSTDPVMAAWAQDAIAQAQKARQGVVDAAKQMADQTVQAEQGLATGLESAATGMLSGKNTLLQTLNSLAPLAKQAIAAGFPGVAEEIKHWMDVAAQGGTVSFQEMLNGLKTALDQLAASGDPTVALWARQQEAQLAAAAAAAQYTGAIQAQTQVLQGFQAAEKAAQGDLAAATAAVQAQQAAVAGLQQKYQAAQQSLADFKNAQLQGTQAQTQAGNVNKTDQAAIQLAMDDLKAAGGNTQAARAALQGQLDALKAQHAQNEKALADQIAGTSDTNQKKQLQDTLAALQQSDQGAEGTLQNALGALNTGDAKTALQSLQDQLTALQTQASQMTNLGALTFDPLKQAVDNATSSVKELDFTHIIQGIGKSQSAIDTLSPALDAANRRLAGMQQAEKDAQDAVTAATAKVQAQQTALAALQQAQQVAATGTATTGAAFTTMGQAISAATTTALDPIPGQFTAAMDAAAAAVTLAGDPHQGGGIAAAWFGPTGLLPELLGKIGGPAIPGSNAASFRPAVEGAFKALVNDGIPTAIDDNMPTVVSGWAAYMNQMKAAALDAVAAIKQAWASVPGAVGGSAGAGAPGQSAQGNSATLGAVTSHATTTSRPSSGPPIYVTILLQDKFGLLHKDPPGVSAELRYSAHAQGLSA